VLAASLLTLLLLMSSSQAQDTTAAAGPESKETVQSPPTDDVLLRSTPRGSVQGFRKAAEEADFVKAVEFLDLRNLPPKYKSVKPELLARMLAIIIEREIWIDQEGLSNDPLGDIGDGLPSYRDELGRIEDGDEEFVLLMQRVPRGDGKFIWKVSNATVAKIADLYDEFGYGPVAEAIAKSVPDVRFLGVELFKWIMMLGAGLIAYPPLMLIGLGLARLFCSPASPLYPRVKRFFIGPFSLLVVMLIMNWIIRDLGLGITGRKIAQAATIDTAIVTWLLLSGIGLIRDVYARRLELDGREGALVLLRPATQAVQLLIVVLAVLVWLDNAGFNITTLLAGLGVGGLAVALALQKPLEDVLGALSLYTQQPVRVGDFCRIGTETGTIEEIGLRTTRIRTLANTVIAIPNARLATDAIDNISAREKILYRPILRLRYDTSPEQIHQVLEGIRDMFTSHERVLQDNHRVRFKEIADDALLVEAYAYLDTTDWAEYLELAEQLNIQILEIVARAGTSLSLPARALHVEQMPTVGHAARD
jgi:MscS family membrane protein